MLFSNNAMTNTQSATPSHVSKSAQEQAQKIVASLEIMEARAEHEICRVFDQALKKLEAANASKAEKANLIWEVRLWTFGPNEAWRNGEDNLPPLEERFGAVGKDLSFFPDGCEPYFSNRFAATQNPVLRARYADFLMVRSLLQNQTSARDWANEAVIAYLNSVKIFENSPEILHQVAAFQALDSAAHLATLKAADKLPAVIDAVRAHLELVTQQAREVEGETVSYGRWAVETGNILLGLLQRQKKRQKKSKSKDMTHNDFARWWCDAAQELARKNQQAGDSFLEQSFWSQSASAAKLVQDKARQWRSMQAIVDARVREATVRAETSSLAAAALLEGVIDDLDTLRDSVSEEEVRTQIVEQQRELKLQIRRYYAQGADELGFVQVPLEINRELLEINVLKFVQLDSLTECLYAVGASLLPDLQKAREWADSQKGVSGLHAVLDIKQMNYEFGGRSYRTEAEKHQWEFYRALDLQFHLNNRVILPLVWDKLREVKNLDADKLLAHFVETEFVGERSRSLVQIGVERYFAGDFVSALHILVPQLEDSIRRLFERAGLPSIKQSKNGDSWEYETYGNLLRRMKDQFPQFLPEELNVYVQRTLTDPTGWNLRNRIAHGFLSSFDCNRFTTETVLHLYLSFCLFQQKPLGENK